MSLVIDMFMNEVLLQITAHVNKAKEHAHVYTWNKEKSIYVYDHTLWLKFLGNNLTNDFRI